MITRVKVRGASGSGDHCGADDGDGDCREQWVAIFGGGVEDTGDPNGTNYISDPASPAWTNESKALYIVALDTGAILAKVAFDASGVTGPSTMKYSFASEPGVIDLNGDSFADVAYIGDLGGNLWKWDLSAVGADGSDSDTLIDNWPAGIYFNAPETDMGGGKLHYRSFYNAPSAAYVNGVLYLAFGSSERRDLLYAGDATRDDNNRFYVIKDLHPTGADAFSTTATETNLSNVTTSGTYVDPGNLGYFVAGSEGEKYVTDSIVFAGYALVGSYVQQIGSCGPGSAYFYAFRLNDALGFFDTNHTAEAADRRTSLGAGIPSNPRVSVAPNPQDDTVWVTTSEGQVLQVEPPLRPGPASTVIYWRQQY
ncbi:MAG: hypothetical protein E6J87_25650 [Deltaproteobacteria bacterium]|nr:MAG: hypothetical protein E6J87_25650 [Deltaproteobacteria bacterium]